MDFDLSQIHHSDCYGWIEITYSYSNLTSIFFWTLCDTYIGVSNSLFSVLSYVISTCYFFAVKMNFSTCSVSCCHIYNHQIPHIWCFNKWNYWNWNEKNLFLCTKQPFKDYYFWCDCWLKIGLVCTVQRIWLCWLISTYHKCVFAKTN